MRFYNEGNKCNCGKRSCPECNPKISKISKPDANGLVNKKTIGNHYMKFDEAFMQGYYDALNEMEEYDEYEEEDAYESYNEEDLENAYLEGYYAALNETSAATKAKQRSLGMKGVKGGTHTHNNDDFWPLCNSGAFKKDEAVRDYRNKHRSDYLTVKRQRMLGGKTVEIADAPNGKRYSIWTKGHQYPTSERIIPNRKPNK